MAANQSQLLPELDAKNFSRNPKTAWLLYLDKLTAWLWQDNEGAARWTLILDDALRCASINHPPRTATGLKNQVTHQSRLKHAMNAQKPCGSNNWIQLFDPHGFCAFIAQW
jgi:hypothetical protein